VGTRFPAPDRFPPGDGWETRNELAERFHLDGRKLARVLRRRVENRSAEMFVGFVMMGRRPLRQVWYRPVRF
jgi:hypothetical protein